MRAASGVRVLHFERIDSTNAEARRLAESGETDPQWIVADEQTAGRGRLGRSWVSAPGSLYATYLMPVSGGPAAAAQLSFVAALAVHDVVSQVIGASARAAIKWPNDVLVNGAKICGLLAEVVGTAPARVAIGCGLNIAHAPDDTPYPVTAIHRHGAKPGVAEVFGLLDACLHNRLEQWQHGSGFGAIRADWAARAIGIGGPVHVAAADGEIAGTFMGLAEDGALIVRTPGDERKPIYAGDVRFAELEQLRQASR